MAISTYRVLHLPSYWECTVEINDSVPVPIGNSKPITVEESIRQMVEFWAGWQEHVKTNKGDYLKTFLQNLARKILFIQCSNNYNLYGIIESFKDEEGWWPMDGSAGIKVIDVDDFDFQRDDLSVRKI